MLQFIRKAVKSVATRVLIYAIKTDRILMGKLAIFMGADVNMEIIQYKYVYLPFGFGTVTYYVDDRYYSPLTCAIFHQKIEWINLLVKKGANINKKASYLFSLSVVRNPTPLFHALQWNYGERNMTPVIDLLLKLGANINHTAKIATETGDCIQTPLLFAIKRKNINLIKLLIAHKADLNLTVDADTPLFEAIGIGNVDIVKLLIQNGADLNAQRIDGKTAIVLAEERFIRVLSENDNSEEYKSKKDNSLYIVKLLINADKARQYYQCSKEESKKKEIQAKELQVTYQ